jgi:hypothetical protein
MDRLPKSVAQDSSGGFLNAVCRKRAQPVFPSLPWGLMVATLGTSFPPHLNFSARTIAVAAPQLSRERLAGLEVHRAGHTAFFLWKTAPVKVPWTTQVRG